MRVVDHYRNGGQRADMVAALEFELARRAWQPGADAVTPWRHHEAPDREGCARAPVCKNLSLPPTLPWRLRVYSSDHSGRSVLLERTSLP